MRRLAAIVLPLAVLVAGLLSRPPAAVGEVVVVGWRPWPAVPCATGAMTAESLPERVVRVTGWIEPCLGTAASDHSRYGIVYFDPAGGVAGRPLEYADPVGRTEFAGQLNLILPGTYTLAACLAYSPTGLLSCVSINAGDDPDRLVVAPIPTDDPRVSLPVLPLIGPEGEDGGYCGTCL